MGRVSPLGAQLASGAVCEPLPLHEVEREGLTR